MFNSIAVNAMPAEGYSTGDAIRAVQETAEIALPKGYGYDFGGITREESQQSGTTVIIFGICILMIYLILSALYESFLIPFAVILAVPAGLMGSFLFARIAGLENNIYLQTGLIMLIGLLAKTAILLTEYAAERRKAGMGLIASAVSAAKARFRPILMTVLTMIFGLFPLVVATGVGANGNRSLGTGVVGGMFIGTLALLFIVPFLFISFQWLQERLRPLPGWSAGCGHGDSRPPCREWQNRQSCLWKQKTPGNSPGSGRRAVTGGFPSVWQVRSFGQAGSSIVFLRLRRRSTRCCGLRTPAGRGAAA